MDAADRAEIIIEEDIEDMILGARNSLNQHNISGLCFGCGDIILPARRSALPGCNNCIDCQNIVEGKR